MHRKLSIGQRTAILYLLITISCVFIVHTVLTNDFTTDYTVNEIWFENQPKYVFIDHPITFELVFQTEQPNQEYTVDLYIDDTKVYSEEIVFDSYYNKKLFSLTDPNPEFGSHRLTLKVYDKDKPYGIHGSKFFPYYLFFNFNYQNMDYF